MEEFRFDKIEFIDLTSYEYEELKPLNEKEKRILSIYKGLDDKDKVIFDFIWFRLDKESKEVNDFLLRELDEVVRRSSNY